MEQEEEGVMWCYPCDEDTTHTTEHENGVEVAICVVCGNSSVLWVDDEEE